jgi:tetratricopeptide (TPR) repeat protein
MALRILALSALTAGLSAQTTPLELGKAVQGDLSETATRDYSITVDANAYLHADVTQAIATVVVELYAPDGKKLVTVDTRSFPKPSRTIWVAQTPGEYHIRVSVPDKGAAVRYEIKPEELRTAGADDGKRREAERLFSQGIGEARGNANDQAIITFARAVRLYGEVKEREREGDTLNAEASAYRNSGQMETAIGVYEQALGIEREIGDRRGEVSTLNGLGVSYHYLSQLEKAISYEEQALKIAREVKDRNGEGSSLNNLGNAYGDLSQNERAIGYFEQALAIRREIHDHAGEAGTLGNPATERCWRARLSSTVNSPNKACVRRCSSTIRWFTSPATSIFNRETKPSRFCCWAMAHT